MNLPPGTRIRHLLARSLRGPLLLLCLAGTGAAQATEAGLTVFAAASLTDALGALARRWEAEGHAPLRLSFAASSTLARQLEAGAPADLFFSANRRWSEYLLAEGLLVEDSLRTPIANALVVVAPADRLPARRDAALLDDLAAALGPDDRIAVGDPEHVPAGLYARQALETLGQWEALAPRLARADNVRAALALVARGEAPLGIVYATDAAISERVRVVAAIPPEHHDPVVYPVAVVAGRDGPEVRALLQFLTGTGAAPVWARYGFLPH
ncbi:MAG: molybdate ABC transporter substrate-binding protein [Pseudomonadales bacterium]|jgi:molybdate transport system substrate-binding protein|nr:molybdate ABC transporter substrate-binding protein [Pseudomonadales bacterium]